MNSEIVEGNKLIQKFIGSINLKDYNESWDWLMPVVEKICEIDNQADVWLASKIEKADLQIFKTSILCHKDAVYERVIEFIQWYKEQKAQVSDTSEAK